MSTYFINMPDDAGKKYHQFTYPGGEVQVRLLESEILLIRSSRKIVMTVNITDGNPLPMVMLADALTSFSDLIERVILILPYLPYSRADRRFVPGDCAGLTVFGGIITWQADDIVTFDVHSPASLDAIADLRNVGAETVITGVLNQLLPEVPTILLPDKGSLLRYDLTSLDYNVRGVKAIIDHCEKQRDQQTGALSGFVVPYIKTPTAIIIDDICDGGGTFVGIAKEIKKTQPDIGLFLYVSHGIFSKGFEELKLYFKNIFTTDSFRSQFVDPDFVKKTPIGGLLKGSVLSIEEVFEQAK